MVPSSIENTAIKNETRLKMNSLPASLQVCENKSGKKVLKSLQFIPKNTILFKFNTCGLSDKKKDFCLRLNNSDSSQWLQLECSYLFYTRLDSDQEKLNLSAHFNNDYKLVQVKTCKDVQADAELYFDYTVDLENECKKIQNFKMKRKFFLLIFF